jgi:Icc-related predicted phosphoesterase
MKILAISDHELPNLYSPIITERFGGVSMILGCGDLALYYLEYIVSNLNKPLYYVNGNHAPPVEVSDTYERSAPLGGIDLHRRTVRDPATGLLLAGIEGSLRYNQGPHQYTQSEMWGFVRGLVPRLWLNKLFHGRYLDVFVTHASPFKIHDQEDLPHRGIQAFNWLIEKFQPAYHVHGHVHIYRQDTVRLTRVGNTQVVNACGFQVLDIPNR